MLKFCSLYSSSSGNCLLVKSDCTNILIDAGVSLKKIEVALESISVDITKISAILITHEHSDHIKSVGNLSKKYNIPVYSNKETWSVLTDEKEKISLDNQKVFKLSQEFSIGDLKIFPFSIPHDAINPCGFNIFNDRQKISIATDLGHIDNNLLAYLKNSSFIMLESNYDSEVLKCCSYPYMLKSRIASPTGHLSNSTAGKVISNLVNFGLKSVMLGHLSKESNFPELAYQSVINELHSNNLSDACIDLSVASRLEPSKIIEVS